VLTFPFKKLRGVAKSQIVQRSTRDVVIRLVVDATFGREDEAHLVEGMRTRLGDGMDVRVEYVDDIPRTGAGKYRWVVSDLGRARAGRPA
jgi:phenylacetate-CoA ligase